MARTCLGEIGYDKITKPREGRASGGTVLNTSTAWECEVEFDMQELIMILEGMCE